jgi:hypothetical protein
MDAEHRASRRRHVQLALVVTLSGLMGCADREPYRRPSTLDERAAGDALANEMLTALGGAQAWADIASVSFAFKASFAGIEAGRRRHDWDKARGLLRVTSGEGEDAVVTYLDLWDRGGVAHDGTRALSGDALQKRLDTAWAHFVNDSYWFIAPFKVFDEGAVRARIEDKLRITFEGGVGLTPGDAYLYDLDERRRPKAWSFLLESGLSGTMEFQEPRTIEGVTVFAKKVTSGGHGVTFPLIELSKTTRDEPFAPLLARRAAR